MGAPPPPRLTRTLGLVLGVLLAPLAAAQNAPSPPARPPSPPVQAPHVAHRIQVDGLLDDWDTGHPLTLADGALDPRPGAAAHWKGASDASASLHVCWDDERLYVGGRVTDDQLLLHARDLWMGDSVEIFLRFGSGGAGGDYQLILAPLAPDIRWSFALVHGRRGIADGGMAGVEVAGKEVRDDQGAYRGYTFEAALPMANFQGFAPPGSPVAINLALVDADTEPGQKNYLLWSGSVLPAYDPSAVVPVRFEGVRSAVEAIPETGLLPGLRQWKVPAFILLGEVLILALLYLLRRPLRRLSDLPFRRKVLFAVAIGAAAAVVRVVPDLVEARRLSRAERRLGAAAETVLSMASDALEARVLVPGKVDRDSLLLQLAEGRRVQAQPEYQYRTLPPVPAPLRRTLGGGTPVRATVIPLEAAGRVVFRPVDPPEAAALSLGVSWRNPLENRTPPPAGAVVGRVTAIGTDGSAETLDLRIGRELDEGPAEGEAHGATHSTVAWALYEQNAPFAPPAAHADEVLWRFPGPARRLAALEVEQIVADGTLTLHGATALPPDGSDPSPLPLGRTTVTGVPTGSWNGRPADEVLEIGPAPSTASIPVGREADVVFLVYGAPGGFPPDQAGKKVLSVRLVMEDGTTESVPEVLENGVRIDGERLPGLDHPEDFQGTLAYRWPGSGGVQVHRDLLALPVPVAPGVRIRSVEFEHLGAGTRVVVDSVCLARRLQRPPPPGLSALQRQGEGYERAASSAAALEGAFLTHYRDGRAVATTLSQELRERVLGAEAPPEVPPAAEPGAAAPAYGRTIGGRPLLACQVRLPLRDADEVVEVSLAAPGVADLETPVLLVTVLLLALLLPLSMTAAIDLLDLLPHLRWKLVGAFGLAAVLPIGGFTVFLARHFEGEVDKGIDQELRTHATAAARGLAARRDEARRFAEEFLREPALLRALDVVGDAERIPQVDALVRDLARRAGGGAASAARVALEVSRPGPDGRSERQTYPIGTTPPSLSGLYEPQNGLAWRWSRLLATGVAKARTATAQLRLVVEIPVDDRVLQDIRRTGGDRSQFLLYSPGGYPVAGTVDPARERAPESVEARSRISGELRRTPGEPVNGSRDIGGILHGVSWDLVRSADGRTVALLETAIPRQPLLAATLGTRDLVLLLGSAALVLAVMVANLFTRRVADPVSDLALTARRIGDGDLALRAAGGGRDEIASLAVAFNGMTDQLQGRIGELSRLNESLAAFAATLDRARVLELTLAAFREAAWPETALVLLADREGGEVEVAAGFLGEASVRPERLPGRGFLGTAARGGTARRVPLPAEAAEAREGDPGERALLAGAAEALVLPFSAGRGRTEGAVVLLHAKSAGGDAAGRASLDFLAALAHQAGIALENARLYRLAVEDPSSGLYASSYFRRRLQEEIDRSLDAGRPASLVMAGIEGLEAVYGKLGPEAGNAVLRGVAERMRGELRRMHLMARAGRDAVEVLLPETPRAAAEEVASLLRTAVERAPFPAGPSGREVRIGLTTAAATAPDDAGSADFLENEAVRGLAAARARRRGGPAEAAEAAAALPVVDAAEADALGFRSAKSLLLLDALTRMAASDVPVLILGETGAGKEVVADLVHRKSRRAAGPMVKLNCAALPAPLLEAELFGYERGAFTGAERRHPGRFEQAHGGTLFLDEIGEMPLELQVKLLRVLQDRKVERLGGTGPVEVDVRIIAATNRYLPGMVEAGRFREDLYFRLNVLSVVVPPLRARREDIPVLATRFLEEMTARDGGGPTGLSPEALDVLFRHPFPGNVRELRNMVERAVVSARGPLVTPRDLVFGQEPARAAPPPPAGGEIKKKNPAQQL